MQALVAAVGHPIRFALPGGHAAARAGADLRLPDRTADTLRADNGDAANARVRDTLAAAGKTAVIPPNRNRKVQREYDRDRYHARHLIEHCCCWRKQCRALATRDDTTKRNFLAAVSLVAVAFLLN